MHIPVSHASCSQELQVLQCAFQLATCTVQSLAASAIPSAVSTPSMLNTQLTAWILSCCVGTSAA